MEPEQRSVTLTQNGNVKNRPESKFLTHLEWNSEINEATTSGVLRCV
ncbi:unnamed protein product [Tetraodon nigroviridis]|uniref:(spotted green pufferfish) hypothetical protein n=1 Tax=Tetraodon nigroviridis TaxID=99883 RepID=Q4SZ51_TETNG|nr:unnamed protein product [Tetraodon nigroviridis]